jgi:hypothetical protein
MKRTRPLPNLTAATNANLQPAKRAAPKPKPISMTPSVESNNEESNIATQKIEELEHSIETKSLSGWRQRKLQNEINSLKSKIREDDTTKTY